MSRGQNERQVNVLLLSRANVVTDLEQFSPTNHLVNRADTKFGHDSTEFVGNVVEEVDNVLGSTLELLAQLRVLRSDTYWACVEMTFPNSDELANIHKYRTRGHPRTS